MENLVICIPVMEMYPEWGSALFIVMAGICLQCLSLQKHKKKDGVKSWYETVGRAASARAANLFPSRVHALLGASSKGQLPWRSASQLSRSKAT